MESSALRRRIESGAAAAVLVGVVPFMPERTTESIRRQVRRESAEVIANVSLADLFREVSAIGDFLKLCS